MNPIISMHMWVSLPNEVRYRIRSTFKIPRSSNTVVDDGVVLSDGTTNEDLKHLSLEKMQGYLEEASTDFHKLFDMMVAKINDELVNPPIVVTPGLIVHTTVIPPQKKAGRPKKNANV